MGSSSSSSLPMASHPCGLIKVCSWKGDTRDRILMVPVAQEVFQCSCEHPMFRLLHTTRNEPSVRHWYAGGSPGTVAEQERLTKLEPEISAQEYYAELFARSATATAVGGEERSTRWMMISLPTTPGEQSEVLEQYLQGATNSCFLTLKEALEVITVCKSSVHASGYLECHHGDALSTLRYWMSKSFATEGRSLILSQAAAFMEVRRMQLANLRAVSPSAMELEVRVGDVSTLRTLEWTVRKLLPSTLVSHHQFISIDPVTTAGCGNVRVRVNLPALTEVLQSLESAVQYPQYSNRGSSDDESILNSPAVTSPVTWLSLTFDQRPIDRVPTPFSPFVETARAIWQQQNTVVVAVQPNERKQKKSRRGAAVSGSSGCQSSNTNSDSESSPKQSNSPEQLSRRNSGGNQIVPESRLNQDTAIVAAAAGQQQSHRQQPQQLQQQSIAQGRRSPPQQHRPYQQFFPPHPRSTPLPRRECYELEDNTPVHYFQPQSGCWVPLWYLNSNGGARLVVAAEQPYQQEGKLLLETEDSLTLIDENEQVYTTPCATFGTKNMLVVMRQA